MFQPENEFEVPAVELGGKRLTLESIQNEKMCLTYKLTIKSSQAKDLERFAAEAITSIGKNCFAGKAVVDEEEFTPKHQTIVFDLTADLIPQPYDKLTFLGEVAEQVTLKVHSETATGPGCVTRT